MMLISRTGAESTTTVTVAGKAGGESSTSATNNLGAMPLTPTKSYHNDDDIGSCSLDQHQQVEDRQLQATPPHDPQHSREDERPNNADEECQPVSVETSGQTLDCQQQKQQEDGQMKQRKKLVERQQPFFIMDWLEDMIADQDVQKIATMLQTPQKQYPEPSPSSISTGSPAWMTPPQSPPPQQCRGSKSVNDIDSLNPRPATPKSSNRKKKSASASRLHLPYRPGAVESSPSRTGCPSSPPALTYQGRTGRTSISRTTARNRCPSPIGKKELFPAEEVEPSSPPSLPSCQARATQTLPQSSQGTSSVSDEASGSCDKPSPNETTSMDLMTKSSMPSSSPFYKKSIAIGNGWNAKGLRKAKQGLWQDALSCWDNALEIRCQLLGDWHLDVANTCNNRGIALGKLGQWDTARQSLERALDIQLHVFGSETHDQVASTIHNLANVYHQAGELEGAIRLFCRSKQVHQALCDQSKHQEKQALSSSEEEDESKDVDKEHADDEIDDSSAASHRREDDSDKSLARGAAMKSPPPELQVARACIAMGHVYYEARQYQDAREAYWDASQIYEKAGLSNKDPQVVQVKRDISDIDKYFENQQRQEERRRMHEEKQRQAAAVATAAAASIVYPHAFPTSSPAHRMAASWSTPSPIFKMMTPPPSTPTMCYYDAVESLATPSSLSPMRHARSASGNPMLAAGTMAMPSPHEYNHHNRVLQF